MPESSLVRYRPAILAITAVAAGYSIFYYLQSNSRQRPAKLHRSNAVHRRRRTRRDPEEPQSQVNRRDNTDQQLLDASQLVDLFDLQFSSERQVDLDQLVQHDSHDSHANLRLDNETAPLRRYLRAVERHGGSSAQRADYEEDFLRTFLAGRVDPGTHLFDRHGDEAFATRLTQESPLRNTYFSRPDAVISAIQDFNSNNPSRRAIVSNNTPTPGRTPDSTTNESLIEEGPNLNLTGVMTDEESEQSWRGTDENEGSRRDGQSLLNMLYHIAEDQARRDGFIHRGVGCNSCGTTPIRGVRYRCSNCPDFDLCEQCESMQFHPKTHLFYKIRVPAPYFDSTRQPQPLQYPGKPGNLPNNLPRGIVKSLAKDSGRELAEIEALWDQFKCLAASEWRADPLEYRMAIDRVVFDKCFLPSPANRRKPSNLPIHDRIFAFFDTDRDGLIGFNEFVMGIATIRSSDKEAKLRRTFDCYDIDGDGFIRRKDLLRLFWSYYALTKDFTEDALMNMEEDIMEGETLRETLQGSQPISATFTGSIPLSQHRTADCKVRDRWGDVVIGDGEEVLENDNTDIGDETEVIGDMAEIATFGNIFDHSNVPTSADNLTNEYDVANMDWPPSVVRHEDAEMILGPGVAMNDIADSQDRLRVLQTASKRRDKARKGAINDRRRREEFYNYTAERTSAAHSAAESHCDDRSAPNLEADAGQEYLYQILEESMNELLDPLFKPKEDLHIEALLCSADRKEFHGLSMADLSEEKFRKLCSSELSMFLNESYNHSVPQTGIDCDASRALWQWVEHQHVVRNGQSGVNAGDSSNFRFASSSYRPCEVQQDDRESESDQSSSSISGTELNQAVNGASVTPSVPDTTGVDEHSRINEELRCVAQAVDERDALRAELAYGLESELARGVQSYDNDPSSVEQEIAETPLQGLLAESGYTVIEGAQEGPEEPVTTDIDAPSSAHTTANIDLSQKPQQHINIQHPRESEPPDPTLPHTRPDAETSSPKLSQISQHAQDIQAQPEPVPHNEPRSTNAAEIRQKYLAMLDCLVEEDKIRGGPGSLNYQEFQVVMKGYLGKRLEFLGMFYDMVLF